MYYFALIMMVINVILYFSLMGFSDPKRTDLYSIQCSIWSAALLLCTALGK